MLQVVISPDLTVKTSRKKAAIKNKCFLFNYIFSFYKQSTYTCNDHIFRFRSLQPLNIPDAYQDPRFDPTVSKTKFPTQYPVLRR